MVEKVHRPRYTGYLGTDQLSFKERRARRIRRTELMNGIVFAMAALGAILYFITDSGDWLFAQPTPDPNRPKVIGLGRHDRCP